MRNTELLLATWVALLFPFATALPSLAAEGTSKAVSTKPIREPSEEVADSSLPACFGELSEIPLPKSLDWARDVRWVGEREVAIAAVKSGVVRLNLDRPKDPPIVEVAPGGRNSSTRSPWSLGSSKQFLAVGSAMLAVGWKVQGATSLAGEDYFEFIQDLDVRQNRMLVLGIRKTEDGTAYEEDGAFVWLGPLGGPNLSTMRPLAFSADGPPAKAMNNCGVTFVGAARFLEDGSFVVVPVTEPGVFLFRADGRLARTWQSDEFGLDGGCDISDELKLRIGIDLDLRMKWVNRRSVVDDILPLGGDRFGLLVRSHHKGTTSWRMEVGNSKGRVGSCKMPIVVPSRWVHLRADRQGSRVALLQFSRFDSLQSKTPIVPPRLLVSPLTGVLSTNSSSPKPNEERKKSNHP